MLLYVGVCAVRKGLHFALQAWLNSKARYKGRFVVVGEWVRSYYNALKPMLADPSVEVLGHRTDVPDLMRQANALVLPSIEEGSALVCGEAIASGCVPLVSEASSGLCRHNENALVHRIGDVEALWEHIDAIFSDVSLLKRLRERGLAMVPEFTWATAGRSFVLAYREVCGMSEKKR